MKRIYHLALLLLLFASSCTVTRQRCQQLYPPIETHTTDTVLQVRETIVHDTTYIAADSSSVEVFFKADSNNNIQVIETKTNSGRRSNTNFITRRNDKVLHAIFDCHCDSMAIYHTFKDLDTNLSVHTTDTKLHRVEVPAQLTWWQQTKVTFGGYAFALLLAQVLAVLGYIAYKVFSVATPQGAAISGGFKVVGWIRKLFS